jgi:hypothetical protein
MEKVIKDLLERIKILEQYVEQKKEQQISFPLDVASQDILNIYRTTKKIMTDAINS